MWGFILEAKQWFKNIIVKNNSFHVDRIQVHFRFLRWERKPLEKEWIILNFYDVTWMIFETLCSDT